VGNINLLHPNVVNNIEKGAGLAVCELNITLILNAQTFENKFEKISKFPTTKLDFNFLIPRGKLYKDIIDIARSIDTNLNYSVSLLDIYDNETDSYISYTLHYEVNSYTTNLTSEDIDTFHKLVIEKFKSHDINLKV
jgi:phenylalanyl-tRNA synthetase beta subunit